jgi:serpin B
MDRVLRVVDPASYNQALNSLDQELRARNRATPTGRDDPLVVDLSSANRLFVQAGLHLLDGFLDTLAAYFGASVGQVDFDEAAEAAREAINDWVADQTRDHIQELIDQGVLDAMVRLVLVNAVYLRADWAKPFSQDATSDGTFHAPAGDVTIPFMYGTERWPWSEGDGWQSVELPYTGGELVMTFVVPDAGQFDRVVSRLDRSMLEELATAQSTRVRLRLPKFTFDRSVMIGRQLRSLGMGLAFSDDADFSGITNDEPLYIGEVVHRAVVRVDEQGTVAAAATAVVMRTLAAVAGEPKRLDVDRPFLFLLRDGPTGALLFAGQVTNPA